MRGCRMAAKRNLPNCYINIHMIKHTLVKCSQVINTLYQVRKFLMIDYIMLVTDVWFGASFS